MMDGQDIILRLRPEPAGRDTLGRDECYRLKVILKRLLRTHGYRCVGMVPVPRSDRKAEATE